MFEVKDADPQPGEIVREATIEDYMKLFDVDRDEATFLWNRKKKYCEKHGLEFDQIVVRPWLQSKSEP